ncbi:MAG: aldose 1-epimerase family protein [Synergistaceae bacterium]|nr:aldose 1-epimerase family protein [Synergistaceae bacterium]
MQTSNNPKIDLMKYAGSLQQAAYVRSVTYTEGRSSGLKAYDIKNGKMSFRVLADKCLDIGEFSYAGVNINFLSKPGLQGLGHYDTNGPEAQRSIMCGLFFTAGLETIGAPCNVKGVDYPMHGRIRTTPAEYVSSDAFWVGDEYHLRVSGEMREAMLFGENLVLRRSIETVYGSKSFTLTDEFENQAFRDEPLMLLYHFNIGWPFLDENTKLYIPTTSITPRNKDAEGHEAEYDKMEAPKDNEPEYVFIHEIEADSNGDTETIAVNPVLNLGVKIAWNVKNLPHFMEWKSIASGDYVVGLEPANSLVHGRAWYDQNGGIHTIAPFAKEKNVLTFTILDGEDEINSAVQAFNQKF